MYLNEWRVGGVSQAEGSGEGISVGNDRRQWGRLGAHALDFQLLKGKKMSEVRESGRL